MNIEQKNKKNLVLVIGIIIIIIIIGIIFGIKYIGDDQNTKLNNGEEVTEKKNTLFSVNDIISGKNNFFEYSNYRWEFLTDDIDSVSIWKGTIKNISNKNLKGNLRLKFYDANKKIIGDAQKYYLEEMDDSSDIFVLEPGEESNISFTYYSEDLKEGYNLHDVKYISIENIE